MHHSWNYLETADIRKSSQKSNKSSSFANYNKYCLYLDISLILYHLIDICVFCICFFLPKLFVFWRILFNIMAYIYIYNSSPNQTYQYKHKHIHADNRHKGGDYRQIQSGVFKQFIVLLYSTLLLHPHIQYKQVSA